MFENEANQLEEELKRMEESPPAVDTPEGPSSKLELEESIPSDADDSPNTVSDADTDDPMAEVTDTAREQDGRPKRINKRQYVKPDIQFVSIDDRPGFETEADKAKNDLLDIVESLKTKRVLSDKVQGVERSSHRAEPMAVLNHGIFKIVIPASEMVDLPENLNGRDPNDVYNLLLSKRMGAEIDYVIKALSPDDTVAVASRKDAMALKQRQYYYGTDRDGNNLLYEGACAEARIICVYGGGIVVDLFGVESYIPLRELSWQRMRSAHDKFAPGERVLVKIQSLDRHDRNNIKVMTSIRLAATNPYLEALKKYNVGSRYVGQVSYIDTSGVFVALSGGVDCLCSFPPRGRPMIGARVSVQILGKEEEESRIWGVIIHASTPTTL